MNIQPKVLSLLGKILIVPVLASLAVAVYATHSWGGYHWARTSNPFTLKLGDNVNSSWDPYLANTSADWSVSSVLDTTVVPGNNLFNPKRCRPVSGRVEVCNAYFGSNGWLGLTQIWISGDHITQGLTKVNDTYFSTANYNTPAWKNLVMCQEVGHNLGLDHQDENFSNPNLGTCMDYTSDPSTNQHPNQHDYDELEAIYAHLDSFTTVSQTKAQLAQLNRDSAGEPGENPSEWGQLVRKNGRLEVYVRDFAGGQRVVTFLILADL